ncbi:MAG: hypothetical protein B7C54_08035 [Acidimicrobiales bacterium mtb01]|nr:hypothetical protein [Actinomycetota bacterium]TEX45064.1 MAG: hypothetical protein B7C54_08035 [Acidimicrobiales bacterium mtb01]
MDRSEWLLIAHIVVFAAWFGTDIATFTLSRRVVSASTAPASRAAIAGAMMSVEIFARLCLPLAFGTGVLTAEERGWIDWGWVSGAIGVVTPLWSLAVWLIHRGSNLLARIDLWWRAAVALGVWIAAIASLASDEPIGVRWLAVKLVCFAVIITAGIVIRFLLRPFSVAFGQILSEGSTPEREAVVAGSIRRAQPFVVVIWASLLVAATMAVAQPVL